MLTKIEFLGVIAILQAKMNDFPIRRSAIRQLAEAEEGATVELFKGTHRRELVLVVNYVILDHAKVVTFAQFTRGDKLSSVTYQLVSDYNVVINACIRNYGTVGDFLRKLEQDAKQTQQV